LNKLVQKLLQQNQQYYKPHENFHMFHINYQITLWQINF